LHINPKPQAVGYVPLHADLQVESNPSKPNMPQITEYDDEEENPAQYIPQSSLLPSQVTNPVEGKYNLAPSKPIRSNINVGPIKKQTKKKTIFESDTTYNQYNYGMPSGRQKTPANTFDRSNVQSQRADSRRLGNSKMTKDYITDSAYPPSQMTEKDPYGHVYDYDKMPVDDSQVQVHETDYVPGGGSRAQYTKVPFNNFVDQMAKRNSLHKGRNLKFNNGRLDTNPMKNSKNLVFLM
jgi:hypothetical protein